MQMSITRSELTLTTGSGPVSAMGHG